jgi:DNA (cytosine-5)-methyltransferase 1
MTREPYKLLDLFSGIGGFSLGLERSGGFKTVAFCEIEPFPRAVLAKHWPEVPCYDDVRTLTAERLAADGIAVDAICGGFPCQDISFSGLGAGIAEGTRSGLWFEVARLVGELRPRVVILENVAALLGRGLNIVLGGLAALGYDAEWHCIPASAVGAPHRRDRIWIMAHPMQSGPENYSGKMDGKGGGKTGPRCESALQIISSRADVADADAAQREGNERSIRSIAEYADFSRASWWPAEPDVGRVANGVPNQIHRLAALGNAVVPQIPELIGRAIMARDAVAA